MDLIKPNSSHLHNINFTNRLTISSVVSGKSRIAIFTLNQHGEKYSINHFKKNITNWWCKSKSWTSCNTHWLSFRPFPSGSSAHTWPSLRKSERHYGGFILSINSSRFYEKCLSNANAVIGYYPASQKSFLRCALFVKHLGNKTLIRKTERSSLSKLLVRRRTQNMIFTLCMFVK